MRAPEKPDPTQTPSDGLKSFPERNHDLSLFFALLSVLLTLLLYLPSLNGEFVNWDDPLYILANPHIRHLNSASIFWLFTHSYDGNWIPFTWLSLALDYQIGGLEPWVYHLDNLILHCLNTFIVFFLSKKLLSVISITGDSRQLQLSSGRSTFIAFGTSVLFGIHPIHVESVAWATERKDLLYGLFFLLSLLVYLDFALMTERKLFRYLSCLGLFLLAILSKPMAVSLPLVLILLDFWPLKRLKGNPSRVLMEKIPFLTISLVLGVATILSQSQVGATPSLAQLPLSFRVMNAFHSLFFYIGKVLVPLNLTAFYPIFLKNTFSFEYVLSALLAILVTCLCFLFRKKWPYLTAAWLYYLVTWGPAAGIIQAGNQATGDRFDYLPSLAPFLLLVAATVVFFSRKRILQAISVIWVLFLGVVTFHQIRIWKNSVSLFENVLKVNPENGLIVYIDLAVSYEEVGRLDDALAEYNKIISLNPFLGNPHYGKGKILSEKGLMKDAVSEFKVASNLMPNYPPLHSDFGMVYERMGRYPEALNEIHESLRLNPNYAETYEDLGIVYRDQKLWEKSLEAFLKARFLDPSNERYLENLIKAYKKMGKFKELLALYQEVARKS